MNPCKSTDPAQVILVWPAEMTLPAVSLLTIATELKHAGYTAKVIYPGDEECSNPDALERFIRRHVSSSTLWVGFSVMTVFIALALDMCRIVRSINPDIKTVWGGYHPMLFPEQTAEHPLVDFSVVGDGEYTAVELTERLLAHRPMGEVEGLVFKTETGIVRTPPREYTDLRELHPIDYSLLEGIKYLADKPNGRPWGGNVGTLHSGSGCPYRCAFCINSALKRPWTGKTAEQLTEDTASLLRHGFKNIVLVDELFFADKKRAFKFMKLCDHRGLKFGWEACMSMHTIKKYCDEELLYFKEHGLIALGVGAESGSEAQLKRLNKAITPQETLVAAERIEKLGIFCQFATIIGTPNESRSDMAATLRMLNGIKSRSPRYSFYLIPQIYRPYPGCELYNQAIQLGYRPPETLENWANLIKSKKQLFTGVDDLPWLDSGTKNLINDVLMCVSIYLQKNSYTAPQREHVAALSDGTQVPVGKIFYDIVEERFDSNPRYDLIEQLSQSIALTVKNVVSGLLKQHQVRFN